jgi:hypothetical protein
MAKDILIVPVSTISSESTFSVHRGAAKEAEARNGGDPDLHQGLGSCRSKTATECRGQGI